jgi:hypothetical protein
LRFLGVLGVRCVFGGLGLYGFGAGFITVIGYGFLRVFLLLAEFGVLARFGWSGECSGVGFMVLGMLRLLLWWVLSINNIACYGAFSFPSF